MPGQHQVLDAHIGEGPARHHAVVAAPRAVAVEINGLHAVLDEIFAGGRVFLEAAGGRDVVGRHGVAKNAERAGAPDLADRARAASRSSRRTAAPGCTCFLRPSGTHRRQRRGSRSTSGFCAAKSLYNVRKTSGLSALFIASRTSCERRPQIAQVNVTPVLVLAKRFGRQIDVHASRQREGDDQRRRHEKIRLHAGVDARLKIPVAAEHARRDQIVLHHRILNRRGQRPRIADARRAAVADEVEAELVEVRLQVRPLSGNR